MNKYSTIIKHCFYAKLLFFATIIQLTFLHKYFPAFPKYVLLHHHRSDWRRGSVWLVSMWKQKQWQILWKGRNVTLFRCRALTRCCAPCGPIWLEETYSVVSVYAKKTEWEIRRKSTDVTLFCCRALAKCCAPSSPIQL